MKKPARLQPIAGRETIDMPTVHHAAGNGNGRLDAAAVKSAAAGRWPDILSRLAGIPAEYLDGREHPCLRCGGTTRMRLIDAAAGAVRCSHCHATGCGDGIATVQWMRGVDFPAALRLIGEYLGIGPATASGIGPAPAATATAVSHTPHNGKPATAKSLAVGQLAMHDDPAALAQAVGQWAAAKPGLVAQQIGRARPRAARWPANAPAASQIDVLAFPGFRPGDWTTPTAVLLYRPDGQQFPAAAGKLDARKVHTLRGSADSLLIVATPDEFSAASSVCLVEGLPDAIALAEYLPPSMAAVTNSHGAGSFADGLAEAFRQRKVYVILDADDAGRAGALRRAEKLHGIAAEVRVVSLPVTGAEKDIRDVVAAGRWQDVFDAMDAAEPWAPARGDDAPPDPAASSKPTATAPATAAVATPRQPALRFLAVELGTIVQAGDRDNFGEVLADDGDSCRVEFVNPATGCKATVTLSKTDLRMAATGEPLAVAIEPPAFATLIDCRALLAMDLRPRFLVRDILVAGQPAVIGGRSKSLKTSIATDLVVSLGSGTPFLGTFAAERCRVAFWSGESGAATIRETARRIADAKNIDLADCSIFWSFDLPKLSQQDHLDLLAETIVKHSLAVAVVDPLYLALLSAETAGHAGNVYAMGSLLMGLSRVGQSTGCTMIVLHHFRKSGQPDPDEPAGLEELSQAGIAEWARQWILLQRRSPYQSDGRHELWMRAGGSAGHGGLHAVDVEEGLLDAETFSGRHWRVEVKPAGDAREERRRAAEQRKIDTKTRQAEDDERRILEAARRYPQGETQSALASLAAISGARAADAIRSLIGQGRVEQVEIKKHRRYETGFRAVENVGRTRSDTVGHGRTV